MIEKINLSDFFDELFRDMKFFNPTKENNYSFIILINGFYAFFPDNEKDFKIYNISCNNFMWILISKTNFLFSGYEI